MEKRRDAPAQPEANPWQAPIIEPHAGLQPELYVSLERDRVVAELWGDPEPRPYPARCTTCGRVKAPRGQAPHDKCHSECPGYEDRPWADR